LYPPEQPQKIVDDLQAAGQEERDAGGGAGQREGEQGGGGGLFQGPLRGPLSGRALAMKPAEAARSSGATSAMV